MCIYIYMYCCNSNSSDLRFIISKWGLSGLLYSGEAPRNAWRDSIADLLLHTLWNLFFVSSEIG